ncbi:YadA-like family protein [Lonepinella sp. BR2930]|uniref:YadA-like family protein n=1 Tax=Lonepinella sp. BR2930 TaxID=3434554 RepID=UPI003F6DCF6B
MNNHQSYATVQSIASRSRKNSTMMKATNYCLSNTKAKFFTYNLFTSALILMSGQSFAGAGIYINDGTDSGCSVTFDGGTTSDIYTGIYSLNSSLPLTDNRIDSGHTIKTNAANHIKGYYPVDSCSPKDKETQTYRALFYQNADSYYSGSTSLTLGGRLDVNSGIIGVGNRGNNGTNATNSIRMGTGKSLDATNDKTNAITIGVNSSASAENAIALGNATTASANNTIAIGNGTVANEKQSVVIGDGASSSSNAAVGLNVVIGAGAKAIDDATNSRSFQSTVIGSNATAAGVRTLAVGSNATTGSDYAIAMGYNSTAPTLHSLALGSDAQVNATATSDIANATAITNSGSTLLSSTANDSIAAMALGRQAKAAGYAAIAQGLNANASTAFTIALGANSQANKVGSTALGAYTSATATGSVALGEYSVADREQLMGTTTYGTDPLSSVDDTKKKDNVTWQSNAGAVSVGSAAQRNQSGVDIPATTRQITNLAAGTQDTDAVNVAQLKAAGFKLATTASAGGVVDNSSTDDKNIQNGETLTVDAGKNIKVTQTGQKVSIATQDDVEFTSVTAGGTKISSAGLTFVDPFTGVQKGYSPSITATGINAGGTKITNVAAGEADTDAVNVAQLGEVITLLDESVAASQEEVKSTDNSVKVTTTKNTDQANVFDLSVNVDGTSITKDTATGELKANTVGFAQNANGTIKAEANNNALASAKDIANAINNAGFTLKTSANGGKKISGDDEIINAGDEINLTAGKNLTVQQNTKGQVIFSTAENVEFTTVTAGGTKISSAGLTFVDLFTGDQKDYSPSITETGINAGGTKITNVAAGEADTDAVNVAQLGEVIALLDESVAASQEEVKSTDNSVKVTTTKNTDQANVFDLSVNVDGTSITKDNTGALTANTAGFATNANGSVKSESNNNALATSADVAKAINSAGFTLTTSANGGKKISGDDEIINAGDVINLVAGKNLTVKQEANGTVTYSLADEIALNKVATGKTVMDTNGITISGGTADVKLTNTGLDNGGNKITNVAAGTDANDAVNVSQLQAAQAASKETVTSDEGSIVVGVKTDQTTGANIFDLSVNVDDKTITKDSTGALQVNTTDLTVTDGKVSTPKDANALATAANVANAINQSGFTLKTSENGGTKVSGDDELINPADTIDMAAGKNLTVTQEANGKITYATADEVTFTKATANTVVVGDPTTNSTTLTSTANGLDVGGDKITNVANGDISPTSTDAINGSQLSNTTKSIADALGGSSTVNTDGTITAPAYTLVSGTPAQNSTKTYNSVGNALNALNTAVNAPLTFAADSGNNVERQLGSTLNINGDAKNITTTTTSNGVTVALNDNISVKSVSVENGPTINSSGIQMANQQITGLKSGLDGTTIEQVAAQGASSPTWNNAATVGDLAQVQNNVVNSNNRINQLNDKINNVDKKLRAGVAGALATSGLPQAYIPGKSMVAIAAGSFKGENALAVGATRISDNGKVVLKLTGNTNTRGDVGTSVGLGYQW